MLLVVEVENRQGSLTMGLCVVTRQIIIWHGRRRSLPVHFYSSPGFDNTAYCYSQPWNGASKPGLHHSSVPSSRSRFKAPARDYSKRFSAPFGVIVASSNSISGLFDNFAFLSIATFHISEVTVVHYRLSTCDASQVPIPGEDRNNADESSNTSREEYANRH